MRLRRTPILWGYVLAVLAGPALASEPPPASEPPNVLMFIVDDLRPALGAYGDRAASTPHIDALADEGVVFTRAYANVPVCGASRASMLSGVAPTYTRFSGYNSRLDRDLPEAISLPALLKQAGYTTRAYGKVFDSVEDSAYAWSAPLFNPTGDWRSAVPRGERRSDLQKAYRLHPDAGDPPAPGPAHESVPVDDTAYPDGKMAEAVARDLAGWRGGQPFFTVVGLRKPHLPFNAPQRYWREHPLDAVTLPVTFYGDATLPRTTLHAAPELRFGYSGVPDSLIFPAPAARVLKQGYYAAVSYIDAQVGLILNALQTAGLRRNTVVLLVSDHGFHLGEHGTWTKHSLFEVALRVPLIVSLPEAQRITGSSDALADLLDIYPTVARLAGVELPRGQALGGADLMPALLRPGQASGKAVVVSRWIDGVSVRTPRYRYTEWHDGRGARVARTLFDHDIDALEQANVAQEAAYAPVLPRLSEFVQQASGGPPPANVLGDAERFRSLR